MNRIFCLVLCLVPGILLAGTLEPPAQPQPTMYTLEDIYNKIVSGTASGLAAHPADAAAEPEATMHTLKQIYEALAAGGMTTALAVDVLMDKTVIIRDGSGLTMVIGNLVLPQPQDVKQGVAYGAAGAQLTGTFNNLESVTNSPCLRTGQVVTNRAGDDGAHKKGYTGGYTNANGSWNGSTRFADHGDGTVTDNLTGLMWTKDAQQGGTSVNWTNALKGAASCNVGGYGNWRLPNVRELESLMDRRQYNPCMPAGHPFTGISFQHWTSTAYKNSANEYYEIDIYWGHVTHAAMTSTSPRVIYCRDVP